MLTGIFGLAVLIMKLWPTTPIGGCLHRALVEFPLELAGRVERKHIALLGLLLFGPQIVVILGPELALAYAIDLSLYGEALIATTVAAATVRVRDGWQKLRDVKRVAGRVLKVGKARHRSRRTKTLTSRPESPANEDDPAWACALRAA